MTNTAFVNMLLKTDKMFYEQNRKAVLFIENRTNRNSVSTTEKTLSHPTHDICYSVNELENNSEHHYRSPLVQNLFDGSSYIKRSTSKPHVRKRIGQS